MEKIMLAIGKFKEGEGHFEKFMSFMQSEEGMAERRSGKRRRLSTGLRSRRGIQNLLRDGTEIN